jgi:hypothetical protein
VSAILGFGGNIFDVVGTYDTYVEYRLMDATLNPWSYEPIYAVRAFEPTEIASAPKLNFVYLPVGPRGSDPFQSHTNTDETSTTIITDDRDDPGPGVNNVPEPSYTLVLALLIILLWLRTTLRNSRTQ